jgi:hypothetical protein
VADSFLNLGGRLFQTIAATISTPPNRKTTMATKKQTWYFDNGTITVYKGVTGFGWVRRDANSVSGGVGFPSLELALADARK